MNVLKINTMSHSRKKNIAGGYTTSTSEKDDKRLWHRAFRRENRILAKIQILQEDEITFPVVREKSDPWSMAKDGKRFYFTETEIRKNLDSVRKKILRDGYLYRYHPKMWLLERMCKFLNIPQAIKAVSHVKQKDIDRFVQYYINREKSK
jgi:hypothetical protein